MRNLKHVLFTAILAITIIGNINTEPVSKRKIYITEKDLSTFDVDILFDPSLISNVEQNPINYITDNSAAVVSNIKEAQFSQLNYAANYGSCAISEMFYIKPTPPDQTNKFKLFMICKNSESVGRFVESEVTYTGSGTTATTTAGTVTEIYATPAEVTFDSFEFVQGAAANGAEDLTVVVGAKRAGDAEASSVNFYTRTGTGSFAETAIAGPPVVINNAFFPSQNIQLRSFIFNKGSTPPQPRVWFAFQKGIAQGQGDRPSPYISYTNLIAPGEAGSVQDNLYLASTASFTNLKYIVDVAFLRVNDDGTGTPKDLIIVTHHEDSSITNDIILSACEVAIEGTPLKVVVGVCKNIVIPPQYKISNGGYAAAFRADSQITNTFYVYGYNADTNEIYFFDYNYQTGREGETKVNSKFPVMRSGQKFDKIVVERGTAQNEMNCEVYLSNEATGFDQIILYDVNVVAAAGGNPSYLSFRQQSDRDATTLSIAKVGNSRQVFTIKNNAYSRFAPTKGYYIEIYGAMLKNDEGSEVMVTVTQKRGENVLGTAEIGVTVVTGLYSNGEYAGKAETEIKDHFRPDLKPLPFDRSMFIGNNLKFTIEEDGGVDNFVEVNNNEYPVPEALQHGFYIVELHIGVYKTAAENPNIKLFRPNYKYENGLNPEDLAGEHLLGTDQIINIVETNEPGQEGLIITTKKEAADTFGIIHAKYPRPETDPVTFKTAQIVIPGADAANAVPYFNLMGKDNTFQYTWWTVNTAGHKIDIKWVTGIENLAEPFTNFEVTAAVMNIGSDEIFCPVSIIETPINTRRVEVNNYCAGDGDSRIYTFTAESMEEVQQQGGVQAQYRQLNNIQSGEGQLQICGLGEEYLILNPAGTSFLYSANINDDSSSNQLLHQEAGFGKIDKLYCMRRYSGAVIQGTTPEPTDGTPKKGIYSFLFGNKNGDIRSRYHSTNTYDTPETTLLHLSVTQFVLIATAGSHFRFMPINGPIFAYNGQATAAQQTATIKGTNPSAVTTGDISAVFKYTYNTYTAAVEVSPVENQASIDEEGTYNLKDIVTTDGPIFNIKSTNENITITPGIGEDSKFQPQTTVSYPRPIWMLQSSTRGFACGPSISDAGTLQFNFFKNYVDYQKTHDTGLYPRGFGFGLYDSPGDENDIALAVVGVAEGSQKTVMAIAMDSGTSISAAVELQGNTIFDNSNIVVKRTVGTNFMALVTDNRMSVAQLFSIEVRATPGSFSITNTNSVAIFQNIDAASIIESTNTVTVLYTDASKFNLNAEFITVTGPGTYTRTRLQVPDFGTGLQIVSIQCKKLTPDVDRVAQSHCMFTHGADVISDRIVQINTSVNPPTIEFLNPRSYVYFGDYRPTFMEFNLDYLIVKANTPVYTEPAAESKETMLVYRRGSSESEALYWGLTPDQYYYFKQAPPALGAPNFTPTFSAPLIYSEDENGTKVTKIKFSQDPANSPPPPAPTSASPTASPTTASPTTPVQRGEKASNNAARHPFQKARVRNFREEPKWSTFKGMIVQTPQLTLDGTIYSDNAETEAVTINSDTGATGVVASSVPVNKIIADIPGTDSSSGTSSSKEPFMKWWVWVIIAMVIFLVVTAFLLRCLTRVKDDEEEEDIYYDTKQREELAKEGENAKLRDEDED